MTRDTAIEIAKTKCYESHGTERFYVHRTEDGYIVNNEYCKETVEVIVRLTLTVEYKTF
jgi:hypothetical protein